MSFGAMLERMQQQIREEGGLRALSLSGDPSAGAAGRPAPAADPHWRPAPDPGDGSLVQDPDFTLPTTAGPLRWSLFHDSRNAAATGEWGYGRRASFPLKLTTDGSTVTVTYEDGNARQFRQTGSPESYYATGSNYDLLQKNPDGSWDVTLLETGYGYHFPAGTAVAAAYRWSPAGLLLTYQYDASQRLTSVLEPAGRRVTLGYATGTTTTVAYVQDWGDRRHTLAYDAAGNLVQEQGPTGCITQYGYDASHRITSLTDPEGFATTYTYDYAGRVLTRSVAGNLGRYTYQTSWDGSVTSGYTDPLVRTWTHATSHLSAEVAATSNAAGARPGWRGPGRRRTRRRR